MLLFKMIFPLVFAQTPPQLIFIGNSITEGYGVKVEERYTSILSQEIANPLKTLGISGSTSASLIDRVKPLKFDQKDIVVIALGSNDALRALPVSNVKSNLKNGIDTLKTNGAKTIYLVQMEAPPNYGLKYTKEFREAYPLIAKETGVVLIPYFLSNVAGVESLNQEDGIHPNPEGHKKIVEYFKNHLKPHLQLRKRK